MIKKEVNLGDISVLINGDRGKNYPSQADIIANGEIPFINAGHLFENQINFEQMNYISREKFDKLSSGKINSGDILYCLRGSLGKKAIASEVEEGAIASSLVIIRPDRNFVSSEYLSMALESSKISAQLFRANNGSSQPNLSAKSVREYRIALHGMEEQDEIVNHISKVKRVIENRKEQLILLDDLIKSRFVEMFGDGNYANQTLIEIIKEGAGLSYGIVVPGENVNNGIPMIRPSDFKNGNLILDNVYIVDYEIEKKYRKTRLEGNEILVQVIGQPGQVMLTNEDCAGMNVTRNLAVIRHDDRIVNKFYLKEFLLTIEAQTSMLGGTNQSTLMQLPLGTLKKLKVPLPPLKLQNQFADFVQQVVKLKVEVQKSMHETQVLFDSLMQEYFE